MDVLPSRSERLLGQLLRKPERMFVDPSRLLRYPSRLLRLWGRLRAGSSRLFRRLSRCEYIQYICPNEHPYRPGPRRSCSETRPDCPQSQDDCPGILRDCSGPWNDCARVRLNCPRSRRPFLECTSIVPSSIPIVQDILSIVRSPLPIAPASRRIPCELRFMSEDSVTRGQLYVGRRLVCAF
jgi:hypothetical protein